MRFTIPMLAAVLICVAPVSAATLYGINHSSTSGILYGVDTITGAATPIVTLSQPTYSDGDITSLNGVLYVSSIRQNSGSTLLFGSIDPATGTFTSIADIGRTAWTGLAADPAAGIIYGADQGTLFSVTPGGTITTIGNFGATNSMTDLAFDANHGILYGNANGDLYRINTSTGAATFIGITGVQDGRALAYDDATNTLYMTFEGPNDLYSVDPSTAAPTLVGSLGVDILGLADLQATPEPGSSVLLALGLAGLACAARGSATRRAVLRADRGSSSQLIQN